MTLTRITNPLLDVLEVFLAAWASGEQLHGWTIMKTIKRSGPTVYGVLDRLEDAGWVEGYWEDRNPNPGKPPRRFYRLTPTGVSDTRTLLAARRPKTGPARSPGWVQGLSGLLVDGQN